MRDTKAPKSRREKADAELAKLAEAVKQLETEIPDEEAEKITTVQQAIEWLKNHYTQPLHIDDLAAQAHMSPSTFHHHFRALTAMSPLQYQKMVAVERSAAVDAHRAPGSSDRRVSGRL